MAAYTHLLFVVVILCCIHLQLYEAAKISIIPSDGLTPTKIHCTAETTDKSTQRVMLIKLSTGNGATVGVVKADGRAQLLSPYDERDDILMASSIQGAGKVEESNLRLSLLKPTADLSNVYTCIVYYTDIHGKFTEDSDSSYLGVSDPRLHDIQLEMKALKNELVQQRKEIAALQLNVSTIAFTAVATASNGAVFKAKQNLIFPSVTLNVGNAFDVKDGIFTVPKDGFYVFHMSAQLSCWSCELTLELMNEANRIASMTVGSEYFLEHDSISTSLQLAAGDKVNVFIPLASGFKNSATTGADVTLAGYSIRSA